jgi:hypothetical protein
LNGTTDLSQLATFSADDLATDEQREARAEAVKSSLKDRLVEARYREVGERLGSTDEEEPGERK